MKYLVKLLCLSLLLAHFSGHAQSSKKMKKERSNNPLLCDPESGICEIPGAGKPEDNQVLQTNSKVVRIIYFTDPICSSCWGIEPALRKLKLEYGNEIEIEYRMGGLLPSWEIYNSGGISKPSDVAHHWDEVSIHYDMPIDGDVWLEDPLNSSYPPSIAFKAAQMQDKGKAVLFLRVLREMVFLEKKNITRWEFIAEAATASGLDKDQLLKDYNGEAKNLFEEDLKLARQLGVRGFPTLLISDAGNPPQKIYGVKPYAVFEGAILNFVPGAIKKVYQTDWESLFSYYPTLTKKEYSILANLSTEESLNILDKLTKDKKLKKYTCKNGAIWKREQ